MSLPPPVPYEPVSSEDDYELDDEDHEDYLDHEEDHHTMLAGSLALRFLFAGGVAGAGKSYALYVMIYDLLIMTSSLANLHCSIRSAQDLSYYTSTGFISRFYRSSSAITRFQGHRRCRCANILRGWCPWLLDRERSVSH